MPHYRVHRAALVAPPAPPMWSGKLQAFGLTMGNSTVVWKDPPRTHPDSDSGLYVTGTQADTVLHGRISRHVAVWLPFSYGFQQASFAAMPCLLNRPNEGVVTTGLGMALSGHLSTRWYLSGALEGQLSFVPSRILAICLDNCEYQDPVMHKKDRDAVGVVRASLLAGVDLDGWRIYGGVSVRNHPSNMRITYESSFPSEIEADMEFGPWYGMVGVGVQVDLGDYVSLMAQIYQPFPFYQHDLIYGPVLGVALDVHGVDRLVQKRWWQETGAR